MSAIGTLQTCLPTSPRSAFDPYRTCPLCPSKKHVLSRANAKGRDQAERLREQFQALGVIAAAKHPGLRMARVLCVEDEIVVLILAESVVQELGHDTYSAACVKEALALFDDPGDIDLLFTDIRLPESDLGGFELAEKARAMDPKLKVLYTTGDAITDGMEAMYVNGGVMLPKPYTAPDLAEAVKKVLLSN